MFSMSSHVKDSELIAAIKKQDRDLVQSLCKAQPQLINDETEMGSAKIPLYVASSIGNAEIVRILLENGASVNKICVISNDDFRRTTALNIAAEQGHVDVVKLLLLEKDAQIDVLKNNSEAPKALLVASSSGHAEVVRVLLEKGAELNTQDNDGRTALCLAALGGHLSTVQVLVEKGANVNFITGYDFTALSYAAAHGQLATANYLIENRAEVEPVLKFGMSPLYLAASKGKTEIVELLLEKGADIHRVHIGRRDIKTTPLDAAKENKQEKVVALLEEAINSAHSRRP